MREAHFAHSRFVQVARLCFAELLDVQRFSLAQQLAGIDDVGFNVLRSCRERVRLTLPEIVDQADNLLWLKLSGYLTTSRRPPSGRGLQSQLITRLGQKQAPQDG
jgi:hypothetical protein